MKTGAQLRDAAFTFSSHFSMARGGFLYVYTSRADPRLMMRMSREKRGTPTTFTLVVGDQTFTREQWDEAAAALAALGAKSHADS